MFTLLNAEIVLKMQKWASLNFHFYDDAASDKNRIIVYPGTAEPKVRAFSDHKRIVIPQYLILILVAKSYNISNKNK